MKLSARAAFNLANEVTLTGRQLWQIANKKRGERSYNLRDKTCDIVHVAYVIDGVLVERGLLRTVRHRDNSRSYVLTDKGSRVVAHIKNHIGA